MFSFAARLLGSKIFNSNLSESDPCPPLEDIEGGVSNNYTENSLVLPLLDYQEMEGNSIPNQDLKTELKAMINGVVPPEMGVVHEQCIYKVPPSIRETRPEAYTPQTISIGPFHNPRGRDATRDINNILWSMEDLKLKYLRGFLNRTKLSVEDFVPKLRELENKIRNCYAGPVFYNSNAFLKIIITDACFIIELFLRKCAYENWKESDPILSKPWLLNDIEHDLILLENQLPFFVLEDIYEFVGLNREFPSLIQLFNLQNINTERVSPKHFTDLLRISLMPSSFDLGQKEQENNTIRHVYSASQLWEAGLTFEVSEVNEGLLDLEFDDSKGVLKISCFHVHDTTETYLRNILAFEECHFSYSAHITQYLKILDFLINTEKDVSILVDKKIIINWMGDASSVATMINNLCKNVSMPRLNPNYHSLCLSLNAFYENPCNKYKAMFIHEYFNTPWKIASTIAAVLLLLLTLIQTICSVWSLLK